MKTILYLDLTSKKSEIKVHSDLEEFLGGIGTASKLFLENIKDNPVIFTIGPLTAAFPFASKTCALFFDRQKNLRENYGGGRLAASLKFAGFDGLLIKGKSESPCFVEIEDEKVEFKEGKEALAVDLPAKSTVTFRKWTLIDNYFQFGKGDLGENLKERNLLSLSVWGTKSYPFDNPTLYKETYQKILERGKDLKIEFSNFPSCFGCPAGCPKSFAGEEKGLILPYTLVACQFSQKIYNDIPAVFSCLSALGIDFPHEALEEIPQLVYNVRREIKKSVKEKTLDSS